MRQRLSLYTGLGLILALTVAACGGAPAGGAAQKITVEAREFQFQPSTIEVNAGQKVQITFRNAGTLEHDFSIFKVPVTGVKEHSAGTHAMDGGHDDPKLHVSAVNGKSATLEFTPTEAGTYEIHCTVAGHKDAGMTARLVVKPKQ